MSSPLRTLFVSHDSSLYGAQLSLWGLLSAVNRDAILPFVVTPNQGTLVDRLQAIQVPVFVRPLTHWVVSTNGMPVSRIDRWRDGTKNLRSRVWALCHLIEKHKIEVVYTNTVTCLDGALAARMMRRPHVWHLREQVKGNRDLISLLPPALTNRVVVRLSRQLIVNSAALRKAYERFVRGEKITVIHNGIDVTQFDATKVNKTALLQQVQLPDDTRLVAIVASITPRKGHLIFVEAAARVLRHCDKVAFLIVGDGASAYVAKVKARIGELGLSSSFHFLGWRSDVESLLPAVDVLVVASEQEAFGRTLIEAMASSVPVVSTRSGGPEEIVIDEETGFLVPVNDPDAMAKAIVRVLTDSELRFRFGIMGRKRAEELFSLQVYAAKVESVITDCVSRYV